VAVPLTSVRTERRAELASFLRSRRALLAPDDVGLTPGLRRRTPGLRREEVAQLAGVGVTWYTWLEQGRPINVSPQVLDAVARVLRLNRSEHVHLYRLADMPDVGADVTGATELSSDIQSVLNGFGLPACVYSGKYDLLAWNADYAALFPRVTVDGADRNVLFHCFTAGGSDVVPYEMRAHMVAVARSAYARHVGEPDWVDWVQRVSAASPVFASLWASNRVSEPIPLVKQFDCAEVGIFRARTSSFAVVGAPDARMVVYLPAEADDVAVLERLRARQ
jgi:transcriptional regulator with XRE-family HTH domain